MTKRRRTLLAFAIVLVAAAGAWFYQNSSLDRLRREFIPWMHRLERWRDGIEQTRLALRRREPAPSDPAGLARVRDWAWNGLDRLAFVETRVEKPTHDASAGLETTQGRVRFTVGGFRADGTRVERSADLLVAVQWDPRHDPTPAVTAGGQVVEAVPVPLSVSVTLERAVEERSNANPRFHDATAEAGLG
ncbi:MAG TPA: hypothetical protein VK780_01740, partial [Thermoanaerobaculia bacterium]|nr:hypothetical protein [Thermoanaerobaculia bacterium]